jgi:hypothetical protein
MVPCCLRQLLDDRLHLAAQRVCAEHERAHHAQHHDQGGRHAGNPHPLQPGHGGIERVGHEDSEEQRNDDSLRPLQRQHHRDHGQYRKRQAVRINGHAYCRNDGFRRRHGSAQ